MPNHWTAICDRPGSMIVLSRNARYIALQLPSLNQKSSFCLDIWGYAEAASVSTRWMTWFGAGLGERHLYAVDLASGTTAWRHRLPDEITFVEIDQSTCRIAVGTESHEVVMLHATNGRLLEVKRAHRFWSFGEIGLECWVRRKDELEVALKGTRSCLTDPEASGSVGSWRA